MPSSTIPAMGSVTAVRACLLNQCFEPYGDRAEDDAAAVGQGELVVAGGQGAPLLEDVEGAFHDVAAFVGLGVVGDRAPTLGTASFAVGDLVGALGDDRLHAASA